MRQRFRLLVAAAFVSGACGSPTARGGAGAAGARPVAQAGPEAGPPANTTVDPAAGGDRLVGLWQVEGTDARGAYRGQVEVRPDATGALTFIRAVRYDTAKVEDGRDLHWVFTGKLSRTDSGATLEASLRRLDFIVRHRGVERQKTDAPVAISGALSFTGAQALAGTLTGPGYALSDTWLNRGPLPARPIFVNERRFDPAHAPPTPSEKQNNFQVYAAYHGLDVIKPYVSRPEFQAAIHHYVVDRTDRDFYRANKSALRVVGKVIDAISLAETRARADSYRYGLSEKAALYDADIETRFIDPDVGMIPEGGPPGGGPTQQYESGDSALWTAVYLASQVYRYQVTSEAKAMANVLRSLDALLKLQEVTGDHAHFARALRRAKNNGHSVWHPAPPPNSHLEWLEGGNNDMIKGLFYGYLVGWELLCEGGKTGYESYCARIRTNAKHLADDVQLGGSPTANVTNALPAAWLYSIVTNDVGDAITYGATAQGYWAGGKAVLAATPVYYSQGTADWSGAHLSSIGDTIGMLLAKRSNLGGDAVNVYRAHIDASHQNLIAQRHAPWHVLKAAFGTGAGPSSPFIAQAVARLEEAHYPKVSYDIDHRYSSEFCMSPYPGAPWKGDWMSYPQEDRTQGLYSYPLFEMHPDVSYFKLGYEYSTREGFESPGSDYLHLYWFLRKHGLLAATE